MTAVQQSLDGGVRTISPTGRTLTARQQFALEMVQATPGGVTADEVGAALHQSQGRHTADVRCQWDARDGNQVLRSKAVAPLVVRRRQSGQYEMRDPKQRTREPSSQLAALPDELFGVTPE